LANREREMALLRHQIEARELQQRIHAAEARAGGAGA
jgi:hypothetical protein